MESQEMSSSKDLLPGIPNDITLNDIATKLPWEAFPVLSSVSTSWRRAIQHRQVYNASGRRYSRETLVVIKHQEAKDMTAISLYSMSKKAVYRLPPIPHIGNRLSWLSQFISFDGKLYVLGDVTEEQWPKNARFDKAWEQEIYVFDLAGQKQWKPCASIPEPEREYKITVGWGVEVGRDNYWRGGYGDWFSSAWHKYDPATDERRALTPLRFLMLDSSHTRFSRKTFVVGEATYHVETDGIYVHRSGGRTLLHSKISCEEIGSNDSVEVDPWFILAVNDELLAIVHWVKIYYDPDDDSPRGYCVLQSEGFGTESRDIMWRKVPVPFYFDGCTSLAMCPIHL